MDLSSLLSFTSAMDFLNGFQKLLLTNPPILHMEHLSVSTENRTVRRCQVPFLVICLYHHWNRLLSHISTFALIVFIKELI